MQTFKSNFDNIRINYFSKGMQLIQSSFGDKFTSIFSNVFLRENIFEMK